MYGIHSDPLVIDLKIIIPK